METISLTSGIRRGQESQTLLALQQRGVTPDDYAAIGTNPALADDILAAILKHRLFAPPEEQIARLLGINERVWKDEGITETAIRALGDPPVPPMSDERGLYCVVLLAETGDALRTFERNWLACRHVHTEAGTWKWDGLLFTPQGVQQRQNALPRPVGLRWAVAELGRACQNQRVKDVRPDLDRKKVMSMGQEGPLVAALHPKWATSMNGKDIPYMDLPDLEVAPYGRGEFHCAPYLYFFSGYRRVRLHARDVGGRGADFGAGSLR